MKAEGLNRRQVGIMVSERLQPVNNQFDKRYFEAYREFIAVVIKLTPAYVEFNTYAQVNRTSYPYSLTNCALNIHANTYNKRACKGCAIGTIETENSK